MTSTAAFSPLCPGCFAEKGKTGICPHCGYDESLKRGPLVLAHRTLLHNGQYLVGKVLGKPGGFGITYLALDTRLETRVAIKEYLPRDLAGRDAGQATISAHSSEDGEFFRYGLTQFLQEARTLARFDHANIVRVRNFFEENGTGYLVMDYYDGVTLADHLSQQPQGKLPEKTAVGILMPILDGLREVHAKNFLHRDIKPQNIYLTTGNRPILLDFGAARQAMSERSRSLSVVLSEGYAPYEQYHRRGEQGPWTDIYASAAVLYHAVAGEPPPPATERVHKDELEFNALGVSKSLGIALRSGLAVDHKNRPQTMAEFQALLLGDGEPPVLTEVVGHRPSKAVPLSLVTKEVSNTPTLSAIGVGFVMAMVVVVIGMIWFVMGNRGTESANHDAAPVPVVAEAEMQPGKVFKDCPECPEMVVIPAGAFEMGSNSGKSNEKPVHSIKIGQAFALGKTEITVRQWLAVMGGDYDLPQYKTEDEPMRGVSRSDAKEFVRKLSEKTGKSYRLPSEAEWEYACRAGTTHAYCGSDKVDSVGWTGNNGGVRLPAGKEPNAFGLHDMSGNVMEWVEDSYHDSYNHAPSDGTAWDAAGAKGVLRGGSWYEKPQDARAASRFRETDRFQKSLIGLRVARTTETVTPFVASLGTEQKKDPKSDVPSPILVASESELMPGKVFKDCPDCPAMVVIPSGEFQMGERDFVGWYGMAGSSGEGRMQIRSDPVHRVVLAAPIAIGQTEITIRQWRSLMGNEPTLEKPTNWGDERDKCDDDCPVKEKSLEDIQEFIRRISARTGKYYRLPSEAEWEYACRGGNKEKYCGGNRLNAVGWQIGGHSNEKRFRYPVTQKRANAFGLYDLSGNIAELVQDCLHESYIGAPTDGSAWITGDCLYQVTRGGSAWMGDSFESVSRDSSMSMNFVGFRLARGIKQDTKISK